MEQANRQARRAEQRFQQRAQRSQRTKGSVPDPPPPPDPVRALRMTVDSAIAALAGGEVATFTGLCRTMTGTEAAPADREHRRLLTRLLCADLLAAVTRAWALGWQPADVLRLVRREQSTHHLRLAGALIAAELDRYAADTVDTRWRQQLVEAEVTLWWDKQENVLTAFDDSWPGRWPAMVPAALELLWLLRRLTPLEQLGPVPGRGKVIPATTAAASDVDERLLAKVRALLAKAESTTFPAEAETFTAGAQALMTRHSIDAALLAATRGGPGDISSVRIGVDNPYEHAKAVLLTGVADANRCRAVWSKNYGFASVVGFTADLESVELLFTSLLVQATTGLTSAGAAVGAGSRARSRGFRNSYLLAFAHRIGERLRAAMAEATTSAGSAQAAASSGLDLLPVLASRAEAVQQEVARRYPALVEKAVRGGNDPLGWASGRSAADTATLAARTPLEPQKPDRSPTRG